MSDFSVGGQVVCQTNCNDLSFSLKLFICFWNKISPCATKKDPLPYIKHTKCDMEYRAKLKVFKKMVDRLRTKNITWKIISIKNVSQFFIYTVFVFKIRKIVKKIPQYVSHFQTLRGVPGSGLLSPEVPGPKILVPLLHHTSFKI